ncbi:MAG: DUF2589 domain-containing protein, partial [Chloroflexi bacterium]|nr:DUF2589 domain-containing protein [Chloroflexota bacterium]
MPDKQPKKTRTNRKRSIRRQPSDRSTLSAIARGIQHAVNSTQEIMEGHYLRIFNKYFYKDGRPKSVDFNISPEQIVRAPLIALVPLNSLLLDEVVVDMSIKVIDTTP